MSFLSRFFVRPVIAEDWQAGDLAECVTRGPWFSHADGHRSESAPEWGERYVVRSVGTGESGYLLLGFARFGKRRYDARGFRKVTPRADERVAADGAFIERFRVRELVQ